MWSSSHLSGHVSNELRLMSVLIFSYIACTARLPQGELVNKTFPIISKSSIFLLIYHKIQLKRSSAEL